MAAVDDAVLTYGALDLRAGAPYLAVQGSSTGAPEVQTEELAEFLFDGEVVSGQRSGNRELAFRVHVVGATPLALAQAEAALVLEVDKFRNELRWKPPGGASPVSVFETWRAELRVASEDHRVVDASGALVWGRFYDLSIPASPFAMSATETVIPAIPQSGSVTVLADGSSAAGFSVQRAAHGTAVPWSSAPDASVVATGALRVTAPRYLPGGGSTDWGAPVLIRSGSVSFASAKYVSVKLKTTSSYIGDRYLRFYAGAQGVLDPVATQELLGSAGWTQYWFGPIDADSLDQLAFILPEKDPATATDPRTWDLDDVTLTGGVPGRAGQLRSVAVPGSVRTPASLAVTGLTSPWALLVMSCPDLAVGFRPDLDELYYLSGGTPYTTQTAFGAQVRSVGESAVKYRIPARTLRSGAYAVVSFCWVDPGAGVPTQVVTTTATGPDGVTVTSKRRLPTSSGSAGSITGYRFQTVGVLHLPPAPVSPGNTGTVDVTVSGAVMLSEVWLIPLRGDTSVTMIDPPASGGSGGTRVWVDPPSVDLPLGGVWVGTAANRSDAVSAVGRLKTFGPAAMTFTPPNTLLLVAGASSVSGALRAKWHTNAAA